MKPDSGQLYTSLPYCNHIIFYVDPNAAENQELQRQRAKDYKFKSMFEAPPMSGDGVVSYHIPHLLYSHESVK